MNVLTQATHTGQLIVLCGPSGVGKSTIATRLEKEYGVEYIISATTRPKLKDDEQGTKYEHISRDAFFHRLDVDEFLEYAQVYDNYYGTPKQHALQKLAAGKDVLLEIDVQGALQVRYQYPDALMIFILPPDEPTLLKRLEARDRDSAEEITKLRSEGWPTIPSTIELECRTNPFLRADLPELQAAIGMAGAEPVAVFAELRRRKDSF